MGSLERYIEIYCDLFKRAVREGQDLPDIGPMVMNAYVPWDQASPPRLGKLANLVFLLPPVIARKRVYDYLGGAVTSRALANADSRGNGPRVKFSVGRNVCYPTAYLLEWLEEQNASTTIMAS